MPFDLHDDWNVISRTILPLVSQSDIFPGAASQSGIVGVVQSVFFSPKAPTANGWIWGAGPTGVAFKQQGPYAYGVSVNDLWPFASDDDRTDVNGAFLRPVMTCMTPTAWSFAAQAETTYDWDREQ